MSEREDCEEVNRHTRDVIERLDALMQKRVPDEFVANVALYVGINCIMSVAEGMPDPGGAMLTAIRELVFAAQRKGWPVTPANGASTVLVFPSDPNEQVTHPVPPSVVRH